MVNYSPEGYFNLLYNYGPLILHYDETPENRRMAHVVIMIGARIEYDYASFVFIDPSRGEIIELTQEEFIRRYELLERNNEYLTKNPNFDGSNPYYTPGFDYVLPQIVHLPKTIQLELNNQGMNSDDWGSRIIL